MEISAEIVYNPRIPGLPPAARRHGGGGAGGVSPSRENLSHGRRRQAESAPAWAGRGSLHVPSKSAAGRSAQEHADAFPFGAEDARMEQPAGMASNASGTYRAGRREKSRHGTGCGEKDPANPGIPCGTDSGARRTGHRRTSAPRGRGDAKLRRAGSGSAPVEQDPGGEASGALPPRRSANRRELLEALIFLLQKWDVDEKTARLAVALSLEPKNLRALADALADRVAALPDSLLLLPHSRRAPDEAT